MRNLLQNLAPIILLGGLSICLLTLVRTDFGIIVLIFSMLLSPELPIAQLTIRKVVLRVDDIMIMVVFFTWLAKMAINKELGVLKKNPLNFPIFTFIGINIISTLFAIMTGVERIEPISAFFYILKYIEYFMIYFLIINNLGTNKQAKRFVVALLITCFLVCVYASAQIGKVERPGTPFEGAEAEPNTLGGYLMFLFAVNLGIFLYSRSNIWKFSSFFMCLFATPPFLYSLSRGSYFAFIPMYLTFVILSRRKRQLLIIILLLSFVILPSILPKPVTARIASTFVPGTVYEAFGAKIPLELSASYRVENWKGVLDKFRKRPILGYGVSGIGLVDSQYTLTLGETGFLGFSIFIWLMVTIFRNAFLAFRTVEDDWAKGLTLGFLAGFIGLLTHALTAETFIIVRIMEPFWLLTAVVILLPMISSASEQPVSR
jgi:hypothetical protein